MPEISSSAAAVALGIIANLKITGLFEMLIENDDPQRHQNANGIRKPAISSVVCGRMSLP